MRSAGTLPALRVCVAAIAQCFPDLPLAVLTAGRETRRGVAYR
jgi:hypothetical protein